MERQPPQKQTVQESKNSISRIRECSQDMATWFRITIGGVFWKGGSQEVVRPTTTTRLKMENAYIFCNVIKIFLSKKGN
jgi:hypothetical protein